VFFIICISPVLLLKCRASNVLTTSVLMEASCSEIGEDNKILLMALSCFDKADSEAFKEIHSSGRSKLKPMNCSRNGGISCLDIIGQSGTIKRPIPLFKAIFCKT